MRILLSVLFLLFFNAAFAEGYGNCSNNDAVEIDCNTSDDSTYGQRCLYATNDSCSGNAGEYCAGGGGNDTCPTGMYCPGDGAAYCCDTNVSGFRFSDEYDAYNGLGARSKYECYKILDGESEGHGSFI